MPDALTPDRLLDTASDTAPDAAPDAATDDLDDAAFARALAVLLRTGTALAQQLENPSDGITLAERANAFERVAVAVRRTVILARHLREVPAADRAARRAAARREVIRVVEDKIERDAPRGEAADLRVELLERLDAPEFERDLLHRSPAELVGEICRDLGLNNVPRQPGFPRRTPADIARLCARAAAPPGAGLHHEARIARTPARPGPS